MELQTDRVPQSMLAERYVAAIEQARLAQTDSPAWDQRNGVRVLHLEDGVLFMPDDEDQRRGLFGQLAGGITFLFGAVFIVIWLDGEQAEPWMRYAGPGLAALGGYLWWTGRDTNRASQLAPRLTGSYLFDVGLLHVGESGCRTFPAQHLRGFESRRRGDDGADKRTYVLLADSSDAFLCAFFGSAYARELSTWLGSLSGADTARDH